MTIEIDIFTLVLNIGAGLYLLLTALFVVGIRLASQKWIQDLDPLLNQVQKLIMVNNIDRAIKLCNNLEGIPAAGSIKTLLTVANGPADKIRGRKVLALAELEEAWLGVSGPQLPMRMQLLGSATAAMTLGIVVALAPGWPLLIMLFLSWVIPQTQLFRQRARIPGVMVRHRTAVLKVEEWLVNRTAHP